MISKSYIILLTLILFFAQNIFAQTIVDLKSENWKISFKNSRINASPDMDDSNWEKVTIPGNLIHEKVWEKNKSMTMWLRYHISANIHNKNENLALVLKEVFDHDETYFNGVMIGRSPGQGKITSNYGRSRIYLIPDRLIRPDENILAIKLKGSFKSRIGIIKQPFQIASSNIALNTFWQKEIYHLIFVALYIVTGSFFLLLYIQLSQLKVYKWFGIFALVIGLYQFLTNEFRFVLMDTFLVYKLAENICYLSIPVIYFHFCVYFFDIKTIPGTRISPRKAAGYYGLFNSIITVLLVVFFNPVWWDFIITWWAISILPIAGFLFYFMIQKAVMEFNRDAILISFGTALLFFFTVDFYMVQRGIWSGATYFNEGLLVFFLSITFALVFRLIKMQIDVHTRTTRLGTVENMQDRVFNYLNLYLQKPVEKIVSLSKNIKDKSGASFQFNTNISKLKIEVLDMENSLDDILELSRLEVITEPEFLEPVNFYDFISAVIPSNKITHYIKVNQEILLNTSLELVNSFVVRVIDFPAFDDFQHIDLIITSDLNGNIHFRFMLFHSNIRKTRQLRDVLTDINPERGELWVKWAIIREIIRILKGDLEIKIINRKFLNIDIHLEAELPQDESDTPGRPTYIELKPTESEQNIKESVSSVENSVSGKDSRKTKTPKFHSQMTFGELIQYIKARFKK